MKINLLIGNSKGVRSGYFNLDPFAPVDDIHGRSLCSLIDLDNSQGDDKIERDQGLGRHLEANEATEIVAEHILEYVPTDLIEHCLSHWVSKLRRHGKLCLVFTDSQRVFNAHLEGRLNLLEVNKLLLGEQEKPWDFRKSLLSMGELTVLLKRMGLHISMAHFNDVDAVITAERN